MNHRLTAVPDTAAIAPAATRRGRAKLCAMPGDHERSSVFTRNVRYAELALHCCK
jgi:hypothetical protein